MLPCVQLMSGRDTRTVAPMGGSGNLAFESCFISLVWCVKESLAAFFFFKIVSFLLSHTGLILESSSSTGVALIECDSSRWPWLGECWLVECSEITFWTSSLLLSFFQISLGKDVFSRPTLAGTPNITLYGLWFIPSWNAQFFINWMKRRPLLHFV
mgnify:CR=1 FL=1